jgi:hypothetical protein
MPNDVTKTRLPKEKELIKKYGKTFDDFRMFAEKFKDETACREYLFNKRWPNGYVCPKCGCKDYYENKKRRIYQCKNKECKSQCSITSGTTFEKSKTPLLVWFRMIYLIVQKKKIKTADMISAVKINNQKTAYNILEKIQRTALEENAYDKLFGLVNKTDLEDFQKMMKSNFRYQDKITREYVKKYVNDNNREAVLKSIISKRKNTPSK